MDGHRGGSVWNKMGLAKNVVYGETGAEIEGGWMLAAFHHGPSHPTYFTADVNLYVRVRVCFPADRYTRPWRTTIRRWCGCCWPTAPTRGCPPTPVRIVLS